MTAATLAEAQRAYARNDHARVVTLLRGDPTLPASGCALLGNSALALGEHGLALQAFTRLHALQPTLAAAARTLASLHNKRGAARRRGGDEEAARIDFETALRLVPAHREAGWNLALALDALGLREDAVAQLDTHLQAHADDADAQWQAIEWLAASAPSRAVERVRHAPALTDASRLAAIAHVLRRADELDAARLLCEQAYRLTGEGRASPGLRHALAGRLAVSTIAESREAIAHERTQLAAGISALQREWTADHLARCEPALEQLAWSNFNVAYHGENDRDLQRAYAALLERATATLAPRFASPPTQARTRRVGLLSSSFRDCTAGAYFGGWIGWLRDAGFDVFVYQVGPQRDAMTERFAARASHFHFHEGPLLDLAQRVRNDELALLIHPECGMDARLLPLAALRLARRQALGWGHPVTSGLAAIDAYFTCAAMEPADAASHYTERLIPLPCLGVDYTRPAPPPPASRAQLGLPTDAPLVLFPQSLFKIHPDNDAVLDDLVQRCPAVRLVMFRGDHPRWHERFLARQTPAVVRAVHWLDPGSRERYLQVNRACDLMLDTLRWSGGNTSLDAFASGLPVLTCPGATMRARQTFALLGQLGLQTELAVATTHTLAARAAELLDAPGTLRALAGRVEAGLPALFDPVPARAAFVAAVEALCTPQ